MPAYNFKERFVPFVLNGSKPHTIRSRRRNPAKPDDTLYLYSGLRTKYCKKLREEKCEDVRTILITSAGEIAIFRERISDEDYRIVSADPENIPLWVDLGIKGEWLSDGLKNELAWCDGFRPEGSTLKKPGNSAELMIRFWRLTHELPFIGDIIYWNPSPKNKEAT